MKNDTFCSVASPLNSRVCMQHRGAPRKKRIKNKRGEKILYN